jgi:hypothetical protein
MEMEKRSDPKTLSVKVLNMESGFVEIERKYKMEDGKLKVEVLKVAIPNIVQSAYADGNI